MKKKRKKMETGTTKIFQGKYDFNISMNFNLELAKCQKKIKHIKERN